MATTPKGVPHPPVDGSSANDVPVDLHALASWVDEHPGVTALTTAQRDALAGSARWDGRVIFNFTTGQLERYDAAAAVWRAGSVSDHGELTGLGDDDHPQYLTTGRHDTTARHGSTVVDHGQIGGLGDDDHPQYAKKSGATFTGFVNAPARHVSLQRLSTTLSVPNATVTVVPFDTELADTDGMADLATSPTRITIARTGRYLLVGRLAWAGNNTGERRLAITSNGTDIAAHRAPAANKSEQTVAVVRDCVAGNYIELTAYQTSGAALSTELGWPLLTATYLGE